MRQVGTLPSTIDPRIFGDYLQSIGIPHRFLPSKDCTAVWVLNEDQTQAAKIELDAYLNQPEDPRYRGAKATADEVRRQAEQLDRQYRKNVRDVGAGWNGPGFQQKPLTTLLVGVCIAIYIVGWASPRARLWLNQIFLFFPMEARGQTSDVGQGLKAILAGEVWRLWTPALLHANLIHLVFNMWALNAVGALLEVRKGTLFLATLVVLSALFSNIGQYLYLVIFEHQLIPWVGISGVIYALFGYVWIKGRTDLSSGMYLPTSSVQTLLFWLVLGFFGLPFANGAHVAGLLFGMLVGFSRL